MTARPATHPTNMRIDSRLMPPWLIALSVVAFTSCTDDLDLTEQTVTPIDNTGGMARSADGLLAVEFVAEALDQPTDITITTRRDIAVEDVDGPVYQLEPSGLTFQKPIRLMFSTVSTADEEVLVEQVDASGETLEVLSTAAEGTGVVAETSHFSFYVLRRLRRACRGLTCGDPCSLCPPSRPNCRAPPGPRACNLVGFCVPQNFAWCSGRIDGGITNGDASVPPNGDAGPFGDGGPSFDAGPRFDAGPFGDGGPSFDAGPFGDGGPSFDAGAFGDGGPSFDAGPQFDTGPSFDTGTFRDGGPRPDAGPNGDATVVSDGGPNGGDAGVPAPVVITPSLLDFGILGIRCPGRETVTATLNVRVKNTGTGDLRVNSAGLAGSLDFSIIAFSPQRLARGASMNLTIEYRTNMDGFDAGTLTIETDLGSASISVVGEVVPAPNPGGC